MQLSAPPSDVVAAFGDLLATPEGEWLEFKRALPPETVLGPLVSAFANQNGGLLVIGHDPTGAHEGLSEAEAANAMMRLQGTGASMLGHEIEVQQVHHEGRRYVYARLAGREAGGSDVVTSGGAAYVREGVEVKPITPLRALVESARSELELDAFVAMSLRVEEDPALIDYYHAMGRAVEASGVPVKLRRIDERSGDYEIPAEIMREIDDCAFVIGDFTLSPYNVYFEVGYARGRGKRVIQTARAGTVLEFDVRNWRTILYRNATELEVKMVGELEQVYRAVTERRLPPVEVETGRPAL
jgi:hypothetical protein